MAIRLVLADDHPIVLEGLEQLFRSDPRFEVLARATDGEQAVAAVRAHHPDILLLDVRLPDKNGFEVMEALARDGDRTRIVLLTAAIEEAQVLEALRLGAAGLVLKDASWSDLTDCLQQVYAGKKGIDQPTLARAYDDLLRRERHLREITALLTPRELEVFRLAASGLPTKEIAERMSITSGTVKIHLHSIYEKLKLDGRVALVLYGREKGIA